MGSVVNMVAFMGIELGTGLNLHKKDENKFSLKRAANVHQFPWKMLSPAQKESPSYVGLFLH